jgi:hypothetical protein
VAAVQKQSHPINMDNNDDNNNNISFAFVIGPYRSQGSSVSIVSGYGLDVREIKVQSPAGERDFSSSLCVQDWLWGPPSLLSNGC